MLACNVRVWSGSLKDILHADLTSLLEQDRRQINIKLSRYSLWKCMIRLINLWFFMNLVVVPDKWEKRKSREDQNQSGSRFTASTIACYGYGQPVIVHVLQAGTLRISVHRQNLLGQDLPNLHCLRYFHLLAPQNSNQVCFRPYQYFQGIFMEVSYVGYECMGTALDAIHVILHTHYRAPSSIRSNQIIWAAHSSFCDVTKKNQQYYDRFRGLE